MTINRHLAICQSRPYEISDDIWAAHCQRAMEAGFTREDVIKKCGDVENMIPIEIFNMDAKEGAITASMARLNMVDKLGLEPNLEEHMFIMHGPAAEKGLCEWTPLGAFSLRHHFDSFDDHIHTLCEKLGLAYNTLRTDFSLKIDDVYDGNGFSYYKISDDMGHSGEFIQLWSGLYKEMTKDEFIKAMKRDLNIDYSGLDYKEIIKRFETYLYEKEGLDVKDLEERQAAHWEVIRREIESDMDLDEDAALEGEI